MAGAGTWDGEGAAGTGEAYQPLPDAEDVVSLTFQDGTAFVVERPVLEKMEFFTALLDEGAGWAEAEACAEGRPIHLAQDLGAFPLLCAYVRDGVLDLSEGAIESDVHIAQLCEQADYFGVPDLVARLRPILDSHLGIDQNVLDYIAEAAMPMAFAGETLANLRFAAQSPVENVTFADAIMHRITFCAACQHCEFARAHASLVRFHAVDQCDFERARLYGCTFGPGPGPPPSSSPSVTSGHPDSTNGSATPGPTRRTGSLNDVAAPMRTGYMEDTSAYVDREPRWHSGAPDRTRSYPLLQVASGTPTSGGEDCDRLHSGRIASHRGPVASRVSVARGGHRQARHPGSLPPVPPARDREAAPEHWRQARMQAWAQRSGDEWGRGSASPPREPAAIATGGVREASPPQRVAAPPPPTPPPPATPAPDAAFLHGSSFVRALLRGCHFASLQFRGTVDFSSSRLVHCVFSGPMRRDGRSSLVLRQATVVGGVAPPITSRDDLRGAVMRDVAMQGALDDVDFTVIGADGLLTGVDFRGCALRRCSFRGCTLHHCLLDGVALEACALQGATLDSCSLQGALVRGSSAAGATLRECDLRCLRGAAAADWAGASLVSCSLQGLDLRGAVLRDVSFRGCSLNCTSIAGASVVGTAFEDCCTTNLDADGVVGASPSLAKLFAQCMSPRRRRSSSVDARVVRNAINALVTQAGTTDALPPLYRGLVTARGLHSDQSGPAAADSGGSEGGWPRIAAPEPMPPPPSLPPSPSPPPPPPPAPVTGRGRPSRQHQQEEEEEASPGRRTQARRRWQWAARQRSWLSRRAARVSRRGALDTSASSSAFRTESDPAVGAMFRSTASFGRSANSAGEPRAATSRGGARIAPR